MRALPRCLILLACALCLAGCVAGVVAAGAGTYGAIRYFKNQAVAEYPSSLQATYQAAVVSLGELGFRPQTVARLGATDASVQAGNAKVNMVQVPGGRTRVAVSVGTFKTSNNQRQAALIHERIASRTGLSYRRTVPAPSAAPQPASVPAPPPPPSR